MELLYFDHQCLESWGFGKLQYTQVLCSELGFESEHAGVNHACSGAKSSVSMCVCAVEKILYEQHMDLCNDVSYLLILPDCLISFIYYILSHLVGCFLFFLKQHSPQ